jgi:hypothetical protein
MSALDQLLIGGIATASLVAAVVFLRFWRQTRDRFFLFFALSFALEAASRVAMGLLGDSNEASPYFYTVRLVSYGLILLAIWQKNRPR